jgi:hypothetical protein
MPLFKHDPPVENPEPRLDQERRAAFSGSRPVTKEAPVAPAAEGERFPWVSHGPRTVWLPHDSSLGGVIRR